MLGAVDTRRRINLALKHTLEIFTEHIRVRMFFGKISGGCCNFLNGESCSASVIQLNAKPVGDRVIIELFRTACSFVDDVAGTRCEFLFFFFFFFFFLTETCNVSSRAKFSDELSEQNYIAVQLCSTQNTWRQSNLYVLFFNFLSILVAS